MKNPRRFVLLGSTALTAVLLIGTSLTLSAADEAAVSTEATGTAAAQGSVARAVFTSAIVDREPADDLATIPTSTQQVYFFSELRDLEGKMITHRWELNGQVMAEVKFQVGGPRWRIYSSKKLLPEWAGNWTVVITDESGAVLKTSGFEYTAQ